MIGRKTDIIAVMVSVIFRVAGNITFFAHILCAPCIRSNKDSAQHIPCIALTIVTAATLPPAMAFRARGNLSISVSELPGRSTGFRAIPQERFLNCLRCLSISTIFINGPIIGIIRLAAALTALTGQF